MGTIRFCFAPEKAFAALHKIVSERQSIDLHAALKAFYFADKEHLNRYFRPIFGATYRAMKFGPVPLEIYEMAKGEALWLAEVRKAQTPWFLDGFHLRNRSNTHPDLSVFSESDLECLQDGIAKSVGMTFTARTAATHGPDWQKANLGIMSYEDMIDDAHHRDALIEELRETGRFLRL